MKNLAVIICLCLLSNLSAQTNKFNLTFGGYNEEAYVQFQKLLGKRMPKIIGYLGGGTCFWSKTLQSKEYQDQLTKMKPLVKRFGINYIDAGYAFQWVVDNELMVCTPFDKTLHHTLCGKKIVAVLLFEKMFGPVEPIELESIFTPSEHRLMLGIQKYLSLAH